MKNSIQRAILMALLVQSSVMLSMDHGQEDFKKSCTVFRIPRKRKGASKSPALETSTKELLQSIALNIASHNSSEKNNDTVTRTHEKNEPKAKKSRLNNFPPIETYLANLFPGRRVKFLEPEPYVEYPADFSEDDDLDKTEDFTNDAPEKKDNKIPCDKCNRRYSSKEALLQHQETAHLGVRYVCYIGDCRREYTRSTNLKNHISELHEGKKPTCNKCGEECKSRQALYKHKKSCKSNKTK